MFEKFMKKLYNDVMKIASSIIVKRVDLAKAEETHESLIAFEKYLSAIKDDTNFYINTVYDDDILRKVLPELIYFKAKLDINSVPEIYRVELAKLQNSRNIETYEELNNYYRQYMGLPDTSDTRYIYIEDVPELIGRPIHTLNDREIIMISRLGILDKIKKNNPNKKYLNYLGHDRIDLIKMRLSRNFDIMKYSESVDEIVIKSFMKEYHYARSYMMKVMFHPDVYGDTELYNAFFGMMIMCLAIRNTISPDNYVYMNSEYILDNMLRSYDLYDVFKYLPFTYKKRLILSIDNILANKGTDKIVETICNIFSYNSIVVNRYYVLKEHKRDSNGNFIFPKDELGNVDYNKQYDLKFMKINVDDIRRLYDSTRETVEDIVVNDPLWQMNEVDMKTVRKTEFTSLMSEYLSIDTVFEINEMIFEVSYFMNLLIDLRSSTEEIYVFNMYSSEGRSNCFTMLVFILSILAKRLGYDGNIIYSPVHIAEVYKFNLSVIENDIKEIIKEHDLKITVSDVLLKKPETVMNSRDVMSTYRANKNFYTTLQNLMRNCKSYNEYIGLYKIHKILYISTLNSSSFLKSDNTVAVTYADMLFDLDITLFEVLESAELDSSLDNILVYALEKMENVFNDPDLVYLFTNIPNIGSDLISKYLKEMLDIFKESSTVILQVNKLFEIDGTSPVTLDRPIRVFDKIETNTSSYLSDTVIVTDESATKSEIILNDYVYVDSKIMI